MYVPGGKQRRFFFRHASNGTFYRIISDPRARSSRAAVVPASRRGRLISVSTWHAFLILSDFRYKWLNYYVRMSKDVVWAHHERFSLGFSRWHQPSLRMVRRSQWQVMYAASTPDRG